MATAGYFRRGTTRVFFVLTIANKSAPTAAEVNAGTDLTASGDLADMSGFTFKNSPIPIPSMDSVFTPSIPGEDTSDDSTLTFYEPKTGTDAKIATLAKGAAGYLVIFYRGTVGASPAAADKAEVWPGVSTGPARQYGMDATAAKWMTTWAPSSPPSTSATLV